MLNLDDVINEKGINEIIHFDRNAINDEIRKNSDINNLIKYALSAMYYLTIDAIFSTQGKSSESIKPIIREKKLGPAIKEILKI